MRTHEANAEGFVSNTQDKVIEILARHTGLNPDQVSQASLVADLGLNSLALVECLFEIEEAFDISVPYNANTQASVGFDLTSIASIAQSIDDLLTSNAQPA